MVRHLRAGGLLWIAEDHPGRRRPSSTEDLEGVHQAVLLIGMTGLDNPCSAAVRVMILDVSVAAGAVARDARGGEEGTAIVPYRF